MEGEEPRQKKANCWSKSPDQHRTMDIVSSHSSVTHNTPLLAWLGRGAVCLLGVVVWARMYIGMRGGNGRPLQVLLLMMMTLMMIMMRRTSLATAYRSSAKGGGWKTNFRLVMLLKLQYCCCV